MKRQVLVTYLYGLEAEQKKQPETVELVFTVKSNKNGYYAVTGRGEKSNYLHPDGVVPGRGIYYWPTAECE